MSGYQNQAVIAVAAVLGGARVNRAWERAIGQLIKQVRIERVNVVSPIRLGVRYHVPGEVWSPKFTGARLVRYDEERQTLELEIGLPENPVSDARNEIREFMSSAITLAEEFVQVRGISDALPGFRKMLESL